MFFQGIFWKNYILKFFFCCIYGKIKKYNENILGKVRDYMENENQYLEELMQKYRGKSENLLRYIPYFEQKLGQKNYDIYEADGEIKNSVSIPVYDSTLLAFVKEVQKTGLVDRNYVYVLSNYGIRRAQDELPTVARAEFKDIGVIYAVMAKYVLGGMTKGMMWSQAVEKGIFLECLKRLKTVLNVWEHPLA